MAVKPQFREIFKMKPSMTQCAACGDKIREGAHDHLDRWEVQDEAGDVAIRCAFDAAEAAGEYLIEQASMGNLEPRHTLQRYPVRVRKVVGEEVGEWELCQAGPAWVLCFDIYEDDDGKAAALFAEIDAEEGEG